MVIIPRPFGQVLNDAMFSLGRTWKGLIGPALAASIPASVLTVVTFRLTGGAAFLDLVVNNPDTLQRLPEEVFTRLSRPFYLAIAVTLLLQLVAAVFVALAAHRAVAAELGGSLLTGIESSKGAWRRYPVGLTAVLLVTIGVATLFGMGVAVWLRPAASVGTPNPASVLVALILLVAVMGPGIWVGVSASMTSSVVAIEGRGVIESVRRSIRLVRGRWWPTAGFLLVVGLLGGIAVQLIQLVALPLATVGAGGAGLTVASALGVLTQGLLVAAIAAMYTHWYLDLRARREPLSTADLV